MADWILVPSLVSLRNEFNILAPGRDKASEGSIGDAAHKASSSDHNVDDGPDQGSTPSEDADSTPEVHAIDVDKDLRKAGWSMERAVQIIVTRHRTGKDDRLQNVIYNRRIWSRSWGWTERVYTGSNAHTEHAHFSARYTTAEENNTRAWGLLEADDMEVSDLNAALRDADSPLAVISKAIPWQYNGGGLPTGLTALNTLTAIHGYAKTTHDLVQLLVNDDDVDELALAAALAPALAGLVTPAVITAVEDAGGTPLTAEQITAAVETGTRNVLRAGVGEEES